MDTINGEESSSKKKLIVPIIALMLCAVAVLGAGYAYTSSVEVKDNGVEGGQISVDIKDSDGSAFFADTAADIVFTQEKTYTGGTAASTGVIISADGANDGPATVSGKLLSKLGNANVTIKAKDLGSDVTKANLTVEVKLNDATISGDVKVSTVATAVEFYAADSSGNVTGTTAAFTVALTAGEYAKATEPPVEIPLTTGSTVDEGVTNYYVAYLVITKQRVSTDASADIDAFVTNVEKAKLDVKFTVANA